MCMIKIRPNSNDQVKILLNLCCYATYKTWSRLDFDKNFFSGVPTTSLRTIDFSFLFFVDFVWLVGFILSRPFFVVVVVVEPLNFTDYR